MKLFIVVLCTLEKDLSNYMKIKNVLIIIILIILIPALGYGIGYYAGNIYLNREPITKIITSDKAQGIKSEEKYKSIDYSKEIEGLIPISNYDDSFVIDLKYATEDNFTGKKVYNVNVCALQKSTLKKLMDANDEFRSLGYKIKIWDGYRPYDVQQYFWGIVSDSRYIANPNANGSRHNRGTAVDITLVDKKGNELEMPTKFDEFSPKAHRDNKNISKKAKENSELLTSIMIKHGFSIIETEWWHFDDVDSANYPLLNIPLEKFLEK